MGNPNRWSVEGNEVQLPQSLGSLDALDAPRRINGFWQYFPSVYNESAARLESEGLLRMMVSPKTGVATYPDGTDAKPACSFTDRSGKAGCHQGQRCVSLELTRHDCAAVGCFVDTDSCLGDARTALPSATPLTHSLSLIHI